MGALGAGVVYSKTTARPTGGNWGVTFSQKASTAFGLDWRANYRAIIRDLHPRGIRLVAYWDLLEPTPGHYDFRDIDWQIAEAEKAHIPVIIAVGQKVPRWPEFHMPKWLNAKDTPARQARLLAYLSQVVTHLKGSKSLLYWQVENEPFVGFGAGPKLDVPFLEREIALVRRVDPAHKVLETDGGEWGDWTASARMGDAFGMTMYRRVYKKSVGEFTPPRTPDYYAAKAQATRIAAGKLDEPFLCTELQAEPWGPRLTTRMTIEQQLSYFPVKAFDENIDFARRTRLGTYYLWGAEWWYYLASHGHPEYWKRAGDLMRGR